MREMAFSTLKLVTCSLPPTAGANESLVQGPTILTTVKKNALLPLQVRSKEEHERQAPKVFSTVSRRGTLLYLAAASLSGVTFFSTSPVEARVGKLENKRKAMRKLEKLREKAGVSKPETGNEESTTPPQPPLAKEEKPPIPLPPLFPGSERIPAERSVGITLP